MTEPIESAYFNWLCAKVTELRGTPSQTYFKLMQELQNTEFVWVEPMDENRAMDGQDLRNEFLFEARTEVHPSWLHLGCSVLEMMIAFAKRAAFSSTSGKSMRDWFWTFLVNLGLSDFNDASSVRPSEIADILDRLVWRTYEYDGRGGMFPLHDPHHDQRKVEIWYQFCEYLEETE